MNVLRNRWTRFLPLMVMAIIFLFTLALIPAVERSPKNVPIALVNEDQGVSGEKKILTGKKIIADLVKETHATYEDGPEFKWIQVGSYEEVQKGLDDQRYYAALVIPKDFSKKQASLDTTAARPSDVQILVNQGMNPEASQRAREMLERVVDGLNDRIRTGVLGNLTVQDGKLTKDQVSALSIPIMKRIVLVHEVGEYSAGGTSPVLLAQPLWMACMAGAVLLFWISKQTAFSSRRGVLLGKLTQLSEGAFLALIAGFGLTWLADELLNLYIPKFLDTAMFLSLAYYAFFLLMLAVLSWVGIRGILIFILLFFFGLPLLGMAPEYMSAFYRDAVYSWLPLRFVVDGLHELFFFGKGLAWNLPVMVFTGMVGVSMLAILASSGRAVLKRQDG